ncbi:MAG: YlaN family protein [Staphylococcus epidermidis]|nr:YlaN family protein [Staphylococcus epidermidis]
MSNQSKLNSAAYDQLNKDADRILHLIKVQMDNLTLPSCPLYEEVLDTQMFGLQKEVDFAVQLGLVDKEDGKQLMYECLNFLFVINCKNNVFTKLTVCIMYYV